MAVTRLPGGNGNGSTPDGCVAAHVALERADHALAEVRDLRETDRRWYGLVAGIRRDIAGLQAAMNTGFAQFGVRLEQAESKAAKSVHDVEELEDTLVRNLRSELAEAQGKLAANDTHAKDNRHKWKWWALGIVASVIGAIVGAVILAALGVHK